MKKTNVIARLFAGMAVAASINVSAGIITVVEPSELRRLDTYRSFGDGTDFGTGVFRTGERFTGQTTIYGGPVSVRQNELLSGDPIAPLRLESRPSEGTCSVSGGGNLGIGGIIADEQGRRRSCGEGSLAFLFDNTQSEVLLSFAGIGGELPVVVEFFGVAGNRLATIDFESAAPVNVPLSGYFVGFQSQSRNILGFTVVNTDFAGIAIGDFGFGASVPEPTTLVLMTLGIAGMVYSRRRGKARAAPRWC